MTKINLYNMRRMIRETSRLRWKIAQERSRAEKATATLNGMSRSRSFSSRVEDGAILIAELTELYAERSAKLKEMQQALDILIDSLENTEDRTIMRLRYIRGIQTEQIADHIYMTDRMVSYILSRSEKALARMYPEQVLEGK